MSKRTLFIVLMFVLGFSLVSCAPKETGTIDIFANGEDFIRQGFESKDGWNLSFESVELVLNDVSVYQTSPAYDAHQGALTEFEVKESLPEMKMVDLAVGDENADPILVGSIEGVPTGQYNAISWKLSKDDVQSPIVLKGTAEKDNQVIDFVIAFPLEQSYSCGEFVGDVRKGFVETGTTGDVEMTFHFDHIFGDGGLASDDELNQGAVGFGPFAELAEEGQLDLVVDDGVAFSAETQALLYDALTSLGHVGEGHCHFEAVK